jgi:hypothetical protein
LVDFSPNNAIENNLTAWKVKYSLAYLKTPKIAKKKQHQTNGECASSAFILKKYLDKKIEIVILKIRLKYYINFFVAPRSLLA